MPSFDLCSFLLHEKKDTYLLKFRLRLQGPHVLCMEERQTSALHRTLICRQPVALSAQNQPGESKHEGSQRLCRAHHKSREDYRVALNVQR